MFAVLLCILSYFPAGSILRLFWCVVSSCGYFSFSRKVCNLEYHSYTKSFKNLQAF